MKREGLLACRSGKDKYYLWRASDFKPVGQVFEHEGRWYWHIPPDRVGGERHRSSKGGFADSKAAIRSIRRFYAKHVETQDR